LDGQREYRRVEIELRGSFKTQRGDRLEGCAEIQNVGHGGLMFISSASLKRGEFIDLIVYFNDLEIPLKGEVVWTEELAESIPAESKFGVKYSSISPLEQRYLSTIIGFNRKVE